MTKQLLPLFVHVESSSILVTKSSPTSRLPLRCAWPAVTFPAKECHRPTTSTQLYCLVTEALRCEQIALGCYAALSRWKLNPRLIDRKSNALPLHQCTIVTEKYGCIKTTSAKYFVISVFQFSFMNPPQDCSEERLNNLSTKNTLIFHRTDSTSYRVTTLQTLPTFLGFPDKWSPCS